MIRWVIEQSHMADVPVSIAAASVDELKQIVSNIASMKRHRPVGVLTFRHERHNNVELLYARFVGDDGRKRRFMRLRRHHNG